MRKRVQETGVSALKLESSPTVSTSFNVNEELLADSSALAANVEIDTQIYASDTEIGMDETSLICIEPYVKKLGT